MPTPSPIMIPRKVVKSGMLKTLLRMTIRPIPAPTPPRATAMGRPIARTEPKARISTTMAKARPMNSVVGRFEDGERRATGEDLEALDGGRVVGDRLAEGRRLGQVDIGGQVDLGVGELAGQRTLPGDLRLALLGVGGDDGGAGVLGVAVLVGEPGVHGGEELLHAGGDGGVVDALVGAEDDRSRRASGAELGEVLLEHVEAVGALGVGDVGRRVVGGADRAGGAEDDDQGGEPDADGSLAVVVAPGADAGERGLSRRRWRMRLGSCVDVSRGRRCPNRVGPRWRAGCVSVEGGRDWAQPGHNRVSDGAQPRRAHARVVERVDDRTSERERGRGADSSVRWRRGGDRRR